MLIYSKRQQEVTAIKNKRAIPVFIAAFAFNFILFFIKLYIGLSSNSISIYSDGINNLFDSLSSVAGILCFYILSKSTDLSVKFRSEKAEQLMSFVLSVIIFAVGFIFFYNSAERLMYPTPVWFTTGYFITLCFTAVTKLIMFVFLKKESTVQNSDILRVMSTDSLTDFFITSVTVATLIITQKGSYGFDAVAGIFISIMIILSGLKSLKKSSSELLNYPDKKARDKVLLLINEIDPDGTSLLEFSFGEEKRAYLHTKKDFEAENLESVKQKVYNETGIHFYIVK